MKFVALTRPARAIAIAVWLFAGLLAGCTPSRPNVVIIVVDTLRADHLGLYGYPRPTSPNLDRLAEDSIVFESAFTVMSHTLPAHVSLVTGIHPGTHGILSNGWVYTGPYETLAEQLLDDGYGTAAFVSGNPLSRGTGFERGFLRYEGIPPGREGVGALKREGEETNDAVLRWLERAHGEPFFLLVHYFDTHVPYTSPAGEEETFPLEPDETLRERLRASGAEGVAMEQLSYRPVTLDGRELGIEDAVNNYDNQIHRVDRNVGELLAALRAHSLLDETLLVVLSDHGQGLGQHGYYSHGLHLYEEQLRIPLLIRPPRAVAWQPHRVENAVSVLDVAPTVLELVGLPEPGGLHGQSLMGLIRGQDAGPRWLLAQRRHYDSSSQAKRHRFSGRSTLHAVRGDSRFKYLRSGEGEEELFDLRKDPRELHNLAGEQPPELGAMRDRFDALLKQRSAGGPPRAREIDAETREALEALGYAE